MVKKKTEIFFYTGGALPIDFPSYCIRKNVDEDIIRAMRDAHNIVYIYGSRQTGKTSLLLRLEAELRKSNWACCYVDLAKMKSLNPHEWFQHLGDMLVDAVDAQIDMLTFKPKDQLQFETFLRKEIGLEREQFPIQLALFFDEIEGLINYDFSDAFLMTLRNLYQRRFYYPGKLIIGFAGFTRPINLKKDDDTSPFNVAKVFRLEDFSENEALNLTGLLAMLKVKVDERVHKHIYSWTNGHPYLTHRICELIEDKVNNEELRLITIDTIDEIIDNNFSSSVQEDPNINQVVHKIQSLDSYSEQIWQRLVRGQPVYNTEKGFDLLDKTGVVKSESNGQLVIRNKIYEHVFKSNITKPKRDQVFISYSHKDRKWLNDIKIICKPIEKYHKISFWDDSQITPGQKFKEKIEQAIDAAKVAVCLVSPHFLNSDFITTFELPKMLKAAEEDGLVFIWILVSSCLYSEAGIEDYQAAFDPAKPLDNLSVPQRKQILTSICDKIKKEAKS